MHMADALISPVVGGTLWTAGAALTYYSAKKIGPEFHVQKAPLMGVLGAFVFAAQMINFAIHLLVLPDIYAEDFYWPQFLVRTADSFP